MIAGELVHEDNRDARSAVLVIELDAVVGGQVRHCDGPPARTAILEHVLQRWEPVLRKRTCSDKEAERDDEVPRSTPSWQVEEMPTMLRAPRPAARAAATAFAAR